MLAPLITCIMLLDKLNGHKLRSYQYVGLVQVRPGQVRAREPVIYWVRVWNERSEVTDRAMTYITG